MNHQGDQLLQIEANGFDKSQGKTDKTISGLITLAAVLFYSARYYDIELVNNGTGEVKSYSELCVDVSDTGSAALNGAVKSSLELGETDWAGRRIRTNIDGVLIHDTEDKLPAIEPLYYSASVEHSTGDIIVKVVNVQENNVPAQLVLEDFHKASITA